MLAKAALAHEGLLWRTKGCSDARRAALTHQGLAGKVITKHEDHILWVESLVLRNLGPVSRLYDRVIRRYVGIFFCWLGNAIYQTLAMLSHAVSWLDKCLLDVAQINCKIVSMEV